MFMSCHVNLNLVLQIVLWLPTLQAFSSLVKGLYRNIDIRKYSFLTIDEMFLHSNLFHTIQQDGDRRLDLKAICDDKFVEL